jgi:hypothetical protein
MTRRQHSVSARLAHALRMPARARVGREVDHKRRLRNTHRHTSRRAFRDIELPQALARVVLLVIESESAAKRSYAKFTAASIVSSSVAADSRSSISSSTPSMHFW